MNKTGVIRTISFVMLAVFLTGCNPEQVDGKVQGFIDYIGMENIWIVLIPVMLLVKFLFHYAIGGTSEGWSKGPHDMDFFD